MTALNRKSQSKSRPPRKGALYLQFPGLLANLGVRWRRLISWGSLAAAVILLALAILAQSVLLLDPYQRASRVVAALLESQPSLEKDLQGAAAAVANLSEHLALYPAEGISRSAGQAADERAIAAFARWGIRSRDVIAFAGLMNSLSKEILVLDQALQQEFLGNILAPLLAEARRTGGGDLATLNQLYAQIPAALEQINHQRLRLRTVANGAHVIFEAPQFQPILTALQEVYAPPISLSEPALVYYALAVHSWVELPSLCESLEIQYADQAIILGNIYAAVREARQQAEGWGYYRIEPAARWINRRMPALLMSSAALLLIAFAGLASEGRISLRRTRQNLLTHLPPPAAELSSRPFPDRLQAFLEAQADRLRVFLRRFVTASTPRRGPAPPPAMPALQVIQTGLPKAVRRLSRERPLRIGSDPLDTVYIPSARPGAIDIRICPARVGFFVEVIYSEAPVLLNDRPISGARRLNHGDAIQILDTRLIFQES